MDAHNLSVTRKGGFDPEQNICCLLTVVTDKSHIPDRNEDQPYGDFQQECPYEAHEP